MTTNSSVEIAVVGAGIAGIATSYYLCTQHEKKSVLLIDSRQPMSFTTAQSGDNYRNWWPSPTMAEFTNFSIDLMEQIAIDSSNILNMSRRGYVLATRRKKIDDIVAELHVGYSSSDPDLIRIHDQLSSKSYDPPANAAWETAPSGVDVLSSQRLIQQTFPSLSKEIANVVHIRRAGEISGQQLGQYMLEKIRDAGGKRLKGTVRGIESARDFQLEVDCSEGTRQVSADVIVNAAGPFAGKVAEMIGVDLPVDNVFQQKLAFEDKLGAIPRRLPFSIDLDTIELDWSEEERALLAEDTETAWLVGRNPGGVHCRPEGGDNGTWVKLGWAFNDKVSDPQEDLANEPFLDPQYPEIIMRAAAKLNPSLQPYIEEFPSRCTHYGGYYPMTQENWPLIGPLGVPGAYIAGALSGFGSMAACAVGAICASWISGSELPDYAPILSPSRYADTALMTELASARSRGLL